MNLYTNRTKRLSELIKINAPLPVVDRECMMVREAIHGSWFKAIIYDVKQWFSYLYQAWKLRNETFEGEVDE